MSTNVVDINLRWALAEIKVYPLLSTNFALACLNRLRSEGVLRLGTGAAMTRIFC